MKVAATVAECHAARSELGDVVLVPTMGALHMGHVSLMRLAKQYGRHVAVSIFVNPTQFGPSEDLAKYPRPIEADLAKCREAGVDLVFNPSPQQMYPPGEPKMSIEIPGLSDVLEGKFRPGHFSGVMQVVAKLFNIVQPRAAVFGRKDAQQLRVITAMVEMLNFPVEIIPAPTIREIDGLAMSSRNVYLSPEDRQRALVISAALQTAEEEVAKGIHQTNRLIATMQRMLVERHVNIDYIAAVDPITFKAVDQVERPTLLAIAARVGTTRLIDNTTVMP